MEEWKEVRLEECVLLLGDGLHGTPKYTENGEYAFINGNNLTNGRIVIKPETKRVNEDEYLKYKKNLTDRTIFVSINGTIGNVGTYNGEKIILGKSACYFNVLDDIDKTFIKYIVSSPSFKTYPEINATGTTIKNVSLAQMRNYSFLIPPPSPHPAKNRRHPLIPRRQNRTEQQNKHQPRTASSGPLQKLVCRLRIIWNRRKDRISNRNNDSSFIMNGTSRRYSSSFGNRKTS